MANKRFSNKASKSPTLKDRDRAAGRTRESEAVSDRISEAVKVWNTARKKAKKKK